MNKGILVVNKDKDMTSRDVVNELNHIFNMKQIGHTGTLDPMATGVLVICLGPATKLASLLTLDDKEYIATMKLGIKTDTYDITGKVLETKMVGVNKNDILESFEHFEGEYEQEVPIYSAVKLNGKKLYEYARSNIEVSLPKRIVKIKKIELLEYNREMITFKVLVSKGTYIRSLINDIGNYLGCGACMSSLCRTKQGVFTTKEAYTLDDIRTNNFKILDMAQILDNYPKQIVQGEELRLIKNGAIVKKTFDTDYLVYWETEQPVAIYMEYHKDKSLAKPYIML